MALSQSTVFTVLLFTLVVTICSGSVGHKNHVQIPKETLQNGDRSLAGEDFTGRLINPFMLLFIPFLATGFLVVGGLLIIQLVSAFTVGGLGAGLGREFNSVSINRVTDLTKKFVESEECVERVACELRNYVKYSGPMPQIRRSLLSSSKKNGKWLKRMMRGFEATNDCSQFKCNPMKFVFKLQQ